jgi:hypothetical protein
MIITATYQSESRPTFAFDMNPNLSGSNLSGPTLAGLQGVPVTALAMGAAAIAGLLIAYKVSRR